MKALHWIGTSLADLRRFPVSARTEAGTDLRLVQQGVDPRDWKPMPDVGAGVREIRVRTADGAFRVFYVVEDEATHADPPLKEEHAVQRQRIHRPGLR